MLRVRVRPLGAEERPEARKRARRQSLQVRHDRLDRRPHRSRRRRGGQLLRQDLAAPSRARARATHPFVKTDKAARSWAGRQTASGYAAVWATENTREAHLRRDGAPRDLRHHRPAHDRALLRRLRLRRRGRAAPAARPSSATPRACRWAAISAPRRPARRRPSWSPRSRIRSAPTSTATRSSRAGSTPRASCTRRSTTSPGRGDRKPGADGKLPPVGNTVDVANATWTNTIGAPELITVWKDPDFDPAQRAFYYGRVLEIPTPRWTAYDAKYFGVKMAPEVPMTTQERAYTSPIWYTPQG